MKRFLDWIFGECEETAAWSYRKKLAILIFAVLLPIICSVQL